VMKVMKGICKDVIEMRTQLTAEKQTPVQPHMPPESNQLATNITISQNLVVVQPMRSIS